MVISRATLAQGCIALLLAGCNYTHTKDGAEEAEPIVLASDLTYAEVNENILLPYCLSCHSTNGGNRGNVNLETYEAVLAEQDAILQTVVIEKTMPPRGSPALSAYPRAQIKAWIEKGAPEN